ncbi:glycoside hydrolase family 43 protein [Longitalea arenae]|uniref:glycoside hydrolase family 43 protein n=1 Tax=Longitalea arenae TaxID=2812558 RepID=UPI0019672E7D|nr:glycoside hydrolase family 43 protein [Longitalea arenae]
MSAANNGYAGNPVIRHKYTADPAAIEYNGTVYMYTGHDEPPDGVENYVMKDWLCFSSKDMVHWEEHPVPLKATDFAWSKGGAYASQVIHRNGKFYWYVAVSHGSIPGKAIGVAVADKPEGPFTDALGKALITNETIGVPGENKNNLDPTVMIDDDGQAYLFWGNSQYYYVKLKENMIELDGPIQKVDLPKFEEGAWIYKRNGWYYLLYGYDFPEKVAYAMSRNIGGPWVFQGIINEIAGNCKTNSPAILDYKGKTYFIYHNGGLPAGGSHRRSVCIDYMYFNVDGTIKKIIMTSEGVEAV